MKLSKTQQELTQAHEKCGWKLEWEYAVDNKHRHCFWQPPGNYACVTGRYKGHDWELYYSVEGDVIGSYFDKDFSKVLSKINCKHGAEEYDGIENYIKSDAGLRKALDSGRVELEDNNWDEICIFRDGVLVCDGHGTVGDTDDIITDMLPPEEIGPYLDENFT